jgi:hypothetical protein
LAIVLSAGWWIGGEALFYAGPGGVIMSGSDMRRRVVSESNHFLIVPVLHVEPFQVKWITELLSPWILSRDLINSASTPLTIMAPSPYLEISTSLYGMGQVTITNCRR